MSNETKTHVLVTRYNEYIDWIRYIIDKVDFIYIYNKGPNENYFKLFDVEKYKSKILFSWCAAGMLYTLKKAQSGFAVL